MCILLHILTLCITINIFIYFTNSLITRRQPISTSLKPLPCSLDTPDIAARVSNPHLSYEQESSESGEEVGLTSWETREDGLTSEAREALSREVCVQPKQVDSRGQSQHQLPLTRPGRSQNRSTVSSNRDFREMYTYRRLWGVKIRACTPFKT